MGYTNRTFSTQTHGWDISADGGGTHDWYASRFWGYPTFPTANYSVSGGPGDIPVENVSLDYGIVQYTYLDQKHADGTADSNLPATHDLEKRAIS